ncbi:MAG TPA: hypothetical protein VF263_09960 [Longimicrobiaceae bacterium]
MTSDREGTLLHVTNGGVAAELIRASGLGGDVLPWNDVLHDGPVPGGLPLEDLSAVRAGFISGRGWGAYDEVRAELAARDRALVRSAERAETVLWFEHDLYDQLQILQVLDALAERGGAERASLVCIGAFPGVEPFHGLGQLTPEQIASLFPGRVPVARAQLDLAQAAWAAFRSPDPTRIEDVLDGDTSALPFLRAALLRHLEQLPAVGDGLSRTERQLLEAVADGARGPREVFLADQAREEAVFMGDASLWEHVRELADGPEPLLRVEGGGDFRLPRRGAYADWFWEQRLELTGAGRAVLRGEADRLAAGGVDRWLGGVHLRGRDLPWRWDRAARRLSRAGG